MKLTLGENTYSSGVLDLYRLTINEARTIKRHTGLTLADWRIGLITIGREDPDIIAGMVWLLKHRAGETVDWHELGQINAQDVVNGLVWEDSDQELLVDVQAKRDAAANDVDDDDAPPTTPKPDESSEATEADS